MGRRSFLRGPHKANKHYKPWLENEEDKTQNPLMNQANQNFPEGSSFSESSEFLLRIRLSLLPLHLPLHHPAMITSESRIPKSSRSGGRCIMTVMSLCVPIAIL